MSVGMDSASTSPWWVYIVQTASGKLYTGITTDVERRFSEHQHDRRLGAKFFRSDKAEQVVYKEIAPSRSEASRREAAIKKLTRAAKLRLIAAS